MEENNVNGQWYNFIIEGGLLTVVITYFDIFPIDSMENIELWQTPHCKLMGTIFTQRWPAYITRSLTPYLFTNNNELEHFAFKRMCSSRNRSS